MKANYIIILVLFLAFGSHVSFGQGTNTNTSIQNAATITTFFTYGDDGLPVNCKLIHNSNLKYLLTFDFYNDGYTVFMHEKRKKKWKQALKVERLNNEEGVVITFMQREWDGIHKEKLTIKGSSSGFSGIHFVNDYYERHYSRDNNGNLCVQSGGMYEKYERCCEGEEYEDISDYKKIIKDIWENTNHYPIEKFHKEIVEDETKVFKMPYNYNFGISSFYYGGKKLSISDKKCQPSGVIIW